MSDELPIGHRVVWGLLVLVIIGLIGAAFWQRLERSRRSAVEPGLPMASQQIVPPPEYKVREFSLVDQNGKHVTEKDLLGAVWIADFIFTRCGGTCPMMTAGMVELNAELDDAPAIRFVSFSMDPEHDTPEVLAKYAQAQSATAPRWRFLTGSKQEIFRLTRGGFRLAVKEENGTREEPIIHDQHFVLVDQQGHIQGYYSGVSPAERKRLAADARKLLKP